MRLALTLTLLLAPLVAGAAPAPPMTRDAFVAALKAAPPGVLDGVAPAELSRKTVRIEACARPPEEPSEYRCTWLLRKKNTWVRRTAWVAQDGGHWQVIG
jgi:hypothetical protein